MVTAAPRIDPSTLPSSTREQFAFLYTIVCFIAIWSGINFLFGLVNLGIPNESAGRLAVGVITMATALAISAALYLIHPLLRARAFGRATVLDLTNPASDRISNLSKALGIQRPLVLVDDDIQHIDALAFGLPKRRRILLGRGMLLLLSKRPSEFDLRIAHELAHIRNRDVDFGYIARAMTQATKLVLLFCFLVWLFYFGMWTWRGWNNFSVFGDSFGTFIRGYVPAAGWYLGYFATTFFWILIFWAALTSIEYRSFLRSREHYADVLATGIISTADLATAVGKARQKSFSILSNLYAAHPSPTARVATAKHPELMVQPRLIYLFYIGFVCGVVRALAYFYWAVVARAFPSIDTSTIYQTHKTYSEMISDPSARVLFFAQIAFFFLLVFPFVAAAGSLGLRACLGELLKRSSFTRAIYNLGLQSLIFFAAFVIGAIVNPVAATLLHFQFQQNGAWTIDSPWTVLFSSSVFVDGALYSLGYLLTNLLFLFGLRPVLFGKRESRLPSVWWILIILLWLYVYLLVVQEVLLAYTVTLDPTPIITQHFEQLLMGGVLAVTIGICWSILRIAASFVSRRKLGSEASYTNEFAPWLYISLKNSS